MTDHRGRPSMLRPLEDSPIRSTDARRNKQQPPLTVSHSLFLSFAVSETRTGV